VPFTSGHRPATLPVMAPPPNAADQWSAALAGWTIPPEVLARAPEAPWGFPPSLFRAREAPAGALHRLARAGLDGGQTVLDVGCGGGAASMALVPQARHLTGVDTSPGMLASFAAAAQEAAVGHREVLGEWPAVAVVVPAADVVVCRNVVYNVVDIAPFVTALSMHATRRVVIELTGLHPSVALVPLWQHFWNLSRPDGPSAELFVEVIADLGYEATVESEARTVNKATTGTDYVTFVRRRLCLPASLDSEVAAVLAGADTTTTSVVVAWAPRQ
jgi:SAM-dependent methyltransferase